MSSLVHLLERYDSPLVASDSDWLPWLLPFGNRVIWLLVAFAPTGYLACFALQRHPVAVAHFSAEISVSATLRVLPCYKKLTVWFTYEFSLFWGQEGVMFGSRAFTILFF